MTATASRRALLGGLSAIPVLALPIAANAATSTKRNPLSRNYAPRPGDPTWWDRDPIFEAIDRYEKAWTALSEVLSEHDDLSDRIPRDRRKWEYDAFDPNPPADCNDDPEWLAMERRVQAATQEETNAAIAIVSEAPTTIGGLAALFAFLQKNEERGREIMIDQFTGEYDAEGNPLYCYMKLSLFETLAIHFEKMANQS